MTLERGHWGGDARRQFTGIAYPDMMSTPITVEYADGTQTGFDTISGTWAYAGWVCLRETGNPDQIVYIPATQVRTVRIVETLSPGTGS